MNYFSVIHEEECYVLVRLRYSFIIGGTLCIHISIMLCRKNKYMSFAGMLLCTIEYVDMVWIKTAN